MMKEIHVDGAGAQFENQKARIALATPTWHEIREIDGPMTNNEAEYNAVIEALKMAGIDKDSVIYTDSQLVAGHLTKGWKVKADNLKELYKNAKKLMEEKGCRILWIPREENEAGKLLESPEVKRNVETLNNFKKQRKKMGLSRLYLEEAEEGFYNISIKLSEGINIEIKIDQTELDYLKQEIKNMEEVK